MQKLKAIVISPAETAQAITILHEHTNDNFCGN